MLYKNFDKFEITSIDKEIIKKRLIFAIIYFDDKVYPKGDYFDEAFDKYMSEIGEKDSDSEGWERAFVALQFMEIQYRMELMYLCLICQMFEQFLTDIIMEKLEIKKGIYFSEVQSLYKQYGFDFEMLKSWSKIYELRLLVNVIKHADGDSRKKLQEIRKDIFYVEQKTMLKNTINDMTLNITPKEFFEYCYSIIDFINEMPNTFVKKEI